MKNTKKLLTWILAVVFVIACFALVACDDKPQAIQLTELSMPTLKADQMAVIVKNGDKDYTSYVVTLGEKGVEATTAEDVLNYLVEQFDLKIEWQDSQYGKFITSIGGAKPTADNEYVTVLTSVEKDKGNYAGVTTYEVGDVTIVSAQVGVTEMTVEAGAIIYFEIANY